MGGPTARSKVEGGVRAQHGLVPHLPNTRPQHRLERWDPAVHRPVPTYIVIGDKDFGLPEAMSFRSHLEDCGVSVLLDVREGMGHEHPDDLKDTLARAINWIAQVNRSGPDR